MPRIATVSTGLSPSAILQDNPRVVTAGLWHGRGTGKHGAPRSSGISAREDERTTMDHRQGTPLLALGLALAALSFAPAAQEKKIADRRPLAEVRRDAARKQFELIWQFYQQNRVDTFDVYLWSRLLLDARRASSARAADRVAACAEHLDHMRKLETLVKKIRRLGFGRSNDVGASEYWRIEAECWLAEAKSG